MLTGVFAGCSNSGGQSSSSLEHRLLRLLKEPYEGYNFKCDACLRRGGEILRRLHREASGIKIEYVEISTGKALAQMQAENSNTTADVWFGGGVDSYIAANRELGYLEPYVSPEAEAIDESYRDKDGYWTSLALVPAGFPGEQRRSRREEPGSPQNLGRPG